MIVFGENHCPGTLMYIFLHIASQVSLSRWSEGIFFRLLNGEPYKPCTDMLRIIKSSFHPPQHFSADFRTPCLAPRNVRKKGMSSRKRAELKSEVRGPSGTRSGGFRGPKVRPKLRRLTWSWMELESSRINMIKTLEILIFWSRMYFLLVFLSTAGLIILLNQPLGHRLTVYAWGLFIPHEYMGHIWSND